MLTGGLILDVYDDADGTVLKGIYPSSEQIPEQVKTAYALSLEDRQKLPDYLYALVMVGEGEPVRKYACVDAGNTQLNVEYFLKVAHLLPPPVQKTAAANLKVACAWYDLTPPTELEAFL